MPVVDLSRFHRPEIKELIKLREEYRKFSANTFLKNTNTNPNEFYTLFKKIDKLNLRWINGGEVKNFLSQDEIRLAVKYLRFYLELQADRMQELTPIPKEAIIEVVSEDGISAEWNYYKDAKNDHILIYIHGGGHIMGSVNTHRLYTLAIAKLTNLRVLSINYRLAPEYPHPAALNDCVSVYKWILSLGFKPNKVIISGDSAGGYYTLLTLLKLRDEGIALPLGALCFSPSTDMAQIGASVKKNCYTDLILGDTGYIWWINTHIANADPFAGSVSPLYAELKDLPPILIQVSTSEMLFDDSRRFYERAREAGVDITLQTWNDTVHVFQNNPQLPESKEAMDKVRDFIDNLIEVE
jgi:acetyl esterase/lipase